jgi:hypothetical protein
MLDARRILNSAMRFLGMTGGFILSYPNPILYLMLIFGAVIFPYFGAFLLASMLCWSYGGCHAVRNH